MGTKDETKEDLEGGGTEVSNGAKGGGAGGK